MCEQFLDIGTSAVNKHLLTAPTGPPVAIACPEARNRPVPIIPAIAIYSAFSYSQDGVIER